MDTDSNNGKKRSGCFIAATIIGIFALIGSLLPDNEKSNGGVPKEYEWVVGIWTCNTPYGVWTYSLGKDGSFSDNDGHEGSFTIEDGRIYTHLNGTIGYAIEIDNENKRIGPGSGYWMRNIYSHP